MNRDNNRIVCTCRGKRLTVGMRKSVEFPHSDAVFNTFGIFEYVVFFTVSLFRWQDPVRRMEYSRMV